MSEEELQREIVSGAFSMQVADCERNIRIQFERLQQENKQLKAKLEMYENGVYYSSENDKLKEVIDEVREYIKGFDIERLHEICEHNLAEVLEYLLQILDKAKER